MNKVYTRINWKNEPSRETAINEANLNKMDMALNEVDNRTVKFDSSKADKSDLDNLINSWLIDEESGIIAITKVSGEQILFDLNIEKIPVSFSLSDDGILTMITDDGSLFTADIGSMIPVLTFENTNTISVSVNGSGINKTYSFSIKKGAITEEYLQPDYLSDIKVEVASAKASADSASQSSNNASYDAKLAQSYAVGGSGIREEENRDNAKYYKENAEQAAEEAREYLMDLQSAQVTGVKGDLESTYRKGNVNLTADDIGAISVKLLTNENLNDIRTPGFYYAAGGNSVTSKPSGVNHFGLLCERTGNSVYTQILEDPAANTTYKRKYDSGSWSAWVRDGDITGDVNLSGNLYLDKESKIHINENGLMLMNESGDEYLGNLSEVYLKKNELFDLIYPIGSIYMSVNNVNPSTLFGGTWAAWGSGRVPVGVDTDNTNFNSVEKTGGSETVTLTDEEIPSHYHVIGAHVHDAGTLTTSKNGSHAHSATTSINSAGDHVHTASNGASYIAVKEGSYNNSTKITTGSGSYYGAIGNTAGGISRIGMSTNGNHIHTATTTTESDGVHNHPITGSTGKSTAFNSGNAGSGQAHNNLQPYITCYMWKRTS